MKPKGTKPPAPRYHVFWKALRETDYTAYAAFKERLQRRFPFLDPKALDAARYFDGTENPNAVFYPGTITINEFMDRLEAEERESEESTAADTIAEGTRNSTMFRFVVRTLKRYGNSEDARGLFREESEKCVPALDRKELNGIWKSALKYYCLIKQQPGYVPPEQYNAPKEVQWEPPIPFEEITLPPFPVDALPSRVRPYVEAVAETHADARGYGGYCRNSGHGKLHPRQIPRAGKGGLEGTDKPVRSHSGGTAGAKIRCHEPDGQARQSL